MIAAEQLYRCDPLLWVLRPGLRLNNAVIILAAVFLTAVDQLSRHILAGATFDLEYLVTGHALRR